MDGLSPLDAAFLDAEDADPHTSLAIGSMAVLAGPAPSQAEFVATLAPRMRAVRRAQQRVRRIPFDLGPPVWTDLGEFDVDYHIWSAYSTTSTNRSGSSTSHSNRTRIPPGRS